MTESLLIDAVILFVKWTSPIIAVLSLVLFLKPKLFVDLEKKLSVEFGYKKLRKKTVSALEKENLLLQQILLRNDRAVGLFCFVMIVIIILRLR